MRKLRGVRPTCFADLFAQKRMEPAGLNSIVHQQIKDCGMNDIGPGDIVVCVEVGGGPNVEPIRVGCRYCIREVCDAINQRTGAIDPCATLAGIVNIDPKDGLECYYPLCLFRPLRKSDSEIFRKMVKLPEREVA